MKRFAIRFNAPVVLSFAIISLLVLVLLINLAARLAKTKLKQKQ